MRNNLLEGSQVAMENENFKSPTGFLKRMLGGLPDEDAFLDYETWWETEGKAISASPFPLSTHH